MSERNQFCDAILEPGCNTFGEPDNIKELKLLKNKEIVDIGFVQDCDIEGGLAIDYKDENCIKRIVLGFTELGMWCEWHGERK